VVSAPKRVDTRRPCKLFVQHRSRLRTTSSSSDQETAKQHAAESAFTRWPVKTSYFASCMMPRILLAYWAYCHMCFVYHSFVKLPLKTCMQSLRNGLFFWTVFTKPSNAWRCCTLQLQTGAWRECNVLQIAIKWSRNFDWRPHRMSCRYWGLNDPFCCVHRSRDSQCFSVSRATHQNLPFLSESRPPTNTCFFSANTSQATPKRHLDRFSRFCRACPCDHWPTHIDTER